MRKISALASVVIICLLGACSQSPNEVFWPTSKATVEAFPLSESRSNPVQFEPVIEAVPDFAAWEIGEQVTEEQQVYLNRLVEYAWYSYFSPFDRPDCEALAAVLSSSNPWMETVSQHCDLMAEQKYYIMFPMLPKHAVSYYAFPNSPNEIKFVVRVDSVAPWVADVRYYQDGAQMGYMEYMRTVIDFHLVIEDGKLLIGMIDEFYLDEEGAVWDRGEGGDLVRYE
jgi:hypothetical protein